MEEFLRDIGEKVPEIRVSTDPVVFASRFVPDEVRTQVLSVDQVQLATNLANSEDLLHYLSQRPALWHWEKTDSVLWLPAIKRIANVLDRADISDQSTVTTLQAFEALLIEPLAEIASIVTSQSILSLIDRSIAERAWETLYWCMRVLRRLVVKAPSRTTRINVLRNESNAIGDARAVPFWVQDINSSSRDWIQRLVDENQAKNISERVKELCDALSFGLESIDDKVLSIVEVFNGENIVEISSEKLDTIPATPVGTAIKSLLISGATRENLQWYSATRLVAVDIGSYLTPRFIGTQVTSYPSLMNHCINVVLSFRDCGQTATRESVYLSSMELLGRTMRESVIGDEVAESLGFFESDTKIVNVLHELLGSTGYQNLYPILTLFGSKCLSLTGLTPVLVSNGFGSWTSAALNYIESCPRTELNRIHSCLGLCRLMSLVIEKGGAAAFARHFKDAGGFPVCQRRLASDIDIIVSGLIVVGTPVHQAIAISIRANLRLVELAFEALEMGNGGRNLHDIVGFNEFFVPSLKKIFEHPHLVTEDTVAVAAGALGRFVTHDPVSIASLVRTGVVESLAKACENRAVLGNQESLNSLMHCLACLCLHEDGEKELDKLGHPLTGRVIPAVLQEAGISSAVLHDKAFEWNAAEMLGQSLDELIRNRPTTQRDRVLDAVINTIRSSAIDSIDVLHDFCRMVETMCGNQSTAGWFVDHGLLDVLLDKTQALPLNFTHAVPSHGLCRLHKALSQVSSQTHLGGNTGAAGTVIHSWPRASCERFVNYHSQLSQISFDSLGSILHALSPLHLSLHVCALGIKDVAAPTNPAVVEHLNTVLVALTKRINNESLANELAIEKLAIEGEDGVSVLSLIARLAFKYAGSSTDIKAKAEEEKELRRRLRDDRRFSEQVWSVYNDVSDKAVLRDHIKVELIKGLWMAVRGFMCQVARVVNYPSVPRTSRRPTSLGQKVSSQAREAAQLLSILATDVLEVAVGEWKTPSFSFVSKADTVDLLCRMHVEDKHHMTRPLCVDAFYKAGGVDQLLHLLTGCSLDNNLNEVTQGILWWFERTTSLKRMHNAQLTHLLQQPPMDESELTDSTRFDAVSLVASIQHDFAKRFLANWRNDECLKQLSSKASASLLKALTHVLEPNEQILKSANSPYPQPVEPVNDTTSESSVGGSLISRILGWGSMFSEPSPSSPIVGEARTGSKPYVAFSSVLTVARDTATDFMDRTLVLGSSDYTNTTPAQTHIADVCVRLSHNSVLKLGSPNDEEVVRKLTEALGERGTRWRAGTITMTGNEDEVMIIEDNLDTRQRIDGGGLNQQRVADLVSVETDANMNDLSSPEDGLDEFVSYNARHIAQVCFKATVDPSSDERKKRIASTVLACLLHARYHTVADVVDVSSLIELLKQGDKLVPVWLTSVLVCINKLKSTISSSFDILSVVQVLASSFTRYGHQLDSAAADALMRVLADNCTEAQRRGFFVETVIERNAVLASLLRIPRSSSFEGCRSLAAVLAGKIPDDVMTESVAVQIVSYAVSLILWEHKQVELSKLIKSVRAICGEHGLRTPLLPVLKSVLAESNVKWRITNKVRDQKKQRTNSCVIESNQPIINKPTLVLSDTIPIIFESHIEHLCKAFKQGANEIINEIEPSCILSLEDIVYLIHEVCNSIMKGKASNANLPSQFGEKLCECFWPSISPLLTRARDQWAHNRSSDTSRRLSDMNNLTDSVMFVLFDHIDHNMCLSSVWEYLKSRSDSPVTFGDVVIAHKAVQRHSSTNILSWAYQNVTTNSHSTDIVEGLVNCLEVTTRPPISKVSKAIDTSPLSEASPAAAVEANRHTLHRLVEALHDTGASVVTARVETDGNDNGIVSLGIVQTTPPTEQQEENILGGASQEDDEQQPMAADSATSSIEAVREAVRRVLSPLVASDVAVQFPRFYNNRRRNTGSVGNVVAEDFVSPQASPSLFFTESSSRNPETAGSFDTPVVPSEHPLIARSHTGAVHRAAMVPEEPEPGIMQLIASEAVELDDLANWLVDNVPVSTSQDDIVEENDSEVESMELDETNRFEEEISEDEDQQEDERLLAAHLLEQHETDDAMQLLEESMDPFAFMLRQGEGNLSMPQPIIEPSNTTVETSTSSNTTGIPAIAEAARRYGLSESRLLELTGIDPAVLRDLPEDMHADIVREELAMARPGLVPVSDEAAALIASLTNASLRNEVMLSAPETLLRHLPPDLHAEAVLARQRRQLRRRLTQQAGSIRRGTTNAQNRASRSPMLPLAPRPTLTAAQSSVSGFAQLMGQLEWLTNNTENLRRGQPRRTSQTSDGFVIIDNSGTSAPTIGNFPPLPRSVAPRISAATVDKVCKHYEESGAEPPIPIQGLSGLIALLWTLKPSAPGRTAVENLLFNLALYSQGRRSILSLLIDRLEELIGDTDQGVSEGVKLCETVRGKTPLSNTRESFGAIVGSVLLFLVIHIPVSLDDFAMFGFIDRLIHLLTPASKLNEDVLDTLLRILHVLLVPEKNTAPTTRRHRQKGHADSKVDKLQRILSASCVATITRVGLEAKHKQGMDIVQSLCETDTHHETVSETLFEVLRSSAVFVRQRMDSGESVPLQSSERMVEILKLLRNAKAPSLKADDVIISLFNRSEELNALWLALDRSVAVIEAASTSADTRSLIPLIETFLIVHTDESVIANLGNQTLPRTASSRVATPVTTSALSCKDARLVRFVEIHRKVLNHIIRDRADLLEAGSFQIIVQRCPWAVDFDNKRRYFREKLKDISAERQSTKLSVRRSEVFMDSFYQLRHRTGAEMRGKLSVQFTGEEGVDAGGLVREWFGILAREIFNPNYALFRTAGGKASTFHPNPMSYVNPDHLSFFEFCGRVMGKALFDDQRLDAYFTRSFYKRMLNSPVTWMDFEVEDPDYYKQLQWVLNTDLRSDEASAVAEHLAFTVDVEEFGYVRSVELVPNGAHIPVTEDNKKDYVRQVCEYKMLTATEPQVNSFLKGFHELIPADTLGSLFDDKELELLISGLPTIDLTDLRANTDYVNYSSSAPQIQWLWKILETEFSQEQLAWFLQFVTGSAQVPLEGFKALTGMRGPQKFSIHKAYGNDRLPTAHTCFNQLDLPEYDNENIMREKLIKAVTEAHEGFGFI